jgi:hypothetical protein
MIYLLTPFKDDIFERFPKEKTFKWLKAAGAKTENREQIYRLRLSAMLSLQLRDSDRHKSTS